MDDTQRFRVSRVIHAPADLVFARLADPARHTGIDGSGTLEGSDSPQVTETGQRFLVHMSRDDLGHDRTVNTVVAFEPPTRIGWAPALGTSFPCPLVDRPSGRHHAAG